VPTRIEDGMRSRCRLECRTRADAYAPRVAGLDDWLPRYEHREHHERFVRAPPGEALAAALGAPAEPDRIVRTLFRLRGLNVRDRSIEEAFAPPWAEQLERTGTVFVARLAESGRAAIVFDLRARPAAGGSILSTETRVAGGGLRFRAYWQVVRPFSGLIRRRWLIAAARRAEAPSP
jgi:hypothetical protein